MRVKPFGKGSRLRRDPYELVGRTVPATAHATGSVGSASQVAYVAIRTAILRTDLVTGHLYSEGIIARRLGMSRTPTREALQRLEAEGLVDIFPQRGFTVRTLRAEDCTEAYELRSLLEEFAVRRLCKVIERKARKELERIVQLQAESCEDPAVFIELDHLFHISIARLAGLPKTTQLLSNVRGTLWLMGMRLAEDARRREEVVREHRAIIYHLSRRDCIRAAAAVRQHIRSTSKLAIMWATVLQSGGGDGAVGRIEKTIGPQGLSMHTNTDKGGEQ